ncbi:MAG: hypothetical protein WA390_05100 [Nitrososphaeraceae archaeon]|jgi:uncharacterized protein YeeX (DUF496 family)|nr:hypothetical protein [Nitrososphaeraceae archaeon]MDW0136795.1 hypothetical protein [Nitrososphaeraceae archaeon]MDW0143236.1 hypothetical protein [Nitrososphaeraceae archaeon]MDW0144547.1 hypothetical protein [Nitrososphaeraceae archaeon]MDW0147004.1 hypothetical protein [Nitrososphaeraceae archaeon]
MFATDSSSERATSIEDYQYTCTEFITDISRDYKDWVDRYQLSNEESSKRKESIDNVVTTTNNWIRNFCNTIKKVDIVMNDGINKMAENTAGYPFHFEVSINSVKRYSKHSQGTVALRINAIPQEGRLVRLGKYSKNELFLISSSSPVSHTVSEESMNTVDILDDYITLDASSCEKGSIVSITIIVEEVRDDYVSESRGYSTVIMII